jgi:hypothetical protein
MMVASMSFVILMGGMCAPLPAMTARVTQKALRWWRQPVNPDRFQHLCPAALTSREHGNGNRFWRL